MTKFWLVNEEDWCDIERAVVTMMRGQTSRCSLFYSYHYIEFRIAAVKFIKDPLEPAFKLSSQQLKHNFQDSDVCIEIATVHPEGVLEVEVFHEYSPVYGKYNQIYSEYDPSSYQPTHRKST